MVALRMAGIAGQDKLNGIFEYLSEGHRWQMILYRTRHEFTAETVRKCLADDVDGFIVAMPDIDDALKVLSRARTPTVVMNVAGGGIEKRRVNIASIKSDSLKIGREAAQEFLREGVFESYGYVGYEMPFEWSVDRGRGFSERLAEAGFSTSFYNRKLSLADWLGSLEKPAAVFASCDDDAYAIVDACKSLDLAIPSEVAVLGVNNDPILCENSDPAISSIQPDFVGEGRLAAQLLDHMMSGGIRRGESSLRTHLVGIKRIVRRDTTTADSISGVMVQKALALIKNNALNGIGVEDVARRLNVSRPLLDLRFRECLGKSVYDTILKVRLEEVRRRLRTTDERLGEIALACGWGNPASLKNLFKRVYGLSMRAYRRTLSADTRSTSSTSCA